MLKQFTQSFLLATVIATLAGGCGPRLSDEELGEKLGGLPALEGADEPVPLPELDEALTPSDASPAAEPQ